MNRAKLLLDSLTNWEPKLSLVKIIADDMEPLITLLQLHADEGNVNLIITTGGTGFGPRDNTPEATRRDRTRSTRVVGSNES